jgi:C_GCAxxG_C_C family probable redox protein
MKNRADVAIQKFTEEGYNCAQSVLYSFCEDLHIDKDTALKMACGFGGGIARKQEVCGAVTGGIMALGIAHGRGEKEDREVMSANYKEINELMDKFEKKHGSYMCRCLLEECRLATPEGQKYFQENNLKNKVCIPCVKDVIEIIEKIL